MVRIWITVRKKQKILQDTVLVVEPPQTESDFAAIFEEVGMQLDIPSPVLMGKHRRELDQFNRTRFFADDFLETVSFDCMEMEILIDKPKSRFY